MKSRGLLLVAACTLSLTGCLLPITMDEDFHTHVTGSLTLTSADGRVTTYTPDRCDSGDNDQFHGFDLTSSKSRMQMRGVSEPIDGGAVRIRSYEKDEYADVVLRKADCRILDLTVDRNHVSYNDAFDYNDKVILDCSTPAGSRIAGTIDIRHCH